MNSPNTPSALDALLHSRYHGAENIGGIRYQMLYTVFRSLDLCQNSGTLQSVQPEGLEDLDITGQDGTSLYIQVKTSRTSWNWKKLQDPVKKFAEVHRISPKGQYLLVVNFALHGDLQQLADSCSRGQSGEKQVEKKFVRLCTNASISEGESKAILDRLSIVSLPEAALVAAARRSIADTFSLSSELVDTYLGALAARFLDWSSSRSTVIRTDLEAVHARIQEGLSRETEFQAYGAGFIQRISWQPDAAPEDFLEGRRTRPGHIGAGADVVRLPWLERIEQALATAKVCVLRAPSGQGKSALVLRYAHDRWPAEHTFTLRVASSPHEVEQVRSYLEFRATAGLPTFLLVDDIGWQTQQWALVVQQARALDIPVLASCRHEDWFRFAVQSLTGYEVLEPDLTLSEAREIHQNLAAVGKVHEDVVSIEWAFEQLGQPRLLMEYIYLVTHGRLLEGRLRDQLHEITAHGEDPAKLEVVRRVTLAHALGAPVRADALLSNVHWRDDAQAGLRSLVNEYITADGSYLTGLHHVRSQHLATILHELHPSALSTISETIVAVPDGALAQFVAKAFSWPGVGQNQLQQALADFASDSPSDLAQLIVRGVFEAGEYHFLATNLHMFDQALDLVGLAGPTLLAGDLLPAHPTDALSRMAELEGEAFSNFRSLRDLSSQVVRCERGRDFVHAFLQEALQRSPAMFHSVSAGTYRLLDWAALCGVAVPDWPRLRDGVLDNLDLARTSLEDFALLALASYRLDPDYYERWFTSRRDEIVPYLMWQTRSVTLEVNGDILAIEFTVDDPTGASFNEQAVSRLRSLRSAIPYCAEYHSRGLWLVPFGLRPSHDATVKAMPKENLPYSTDVDKNVIWTQLVDAHYACDSFYRHQVHWVQQRKDAQALAKESVQGFASLLEGRPSRFSKGAFEGGDLIVRLIRQLQFEPEVPPQADKELAATFKKDARDWSSSIRNVANQLVLFLVEPTDDIGKLLVQNARMAENALPALHRSWQAMFRVVPDYFSQADLDASELHLYRDFADILEAFIFERPSKSVYSASRLLHERREAKRRATAAKLEQLRQAASAQGVDAVVADDVAVDYPLTYLALAFEARDPNFVEDSLARVLEVLYAGRDYADFYWLVPIVGGRRFIDGGFTISRHQLEQLAAGEAPQWETFGLQPLPDRAYHQLPDFPYEPSLVSPLRGQVVRLVGMLPVYQKAIQRLQEFHASPSRFLQHLAEHEGERLRQLQQDLLTTAEAILATLETRHAGSKQRESYQEIMQLANDAKRSLTDEQNSTTLVTNAGDAEQLNEALRDLLNVNPE